jgi:hypothetical protein
VIAMGELDITKRIKIIELLKSQLLNDVSMIYSNMAAEDVSNDENINMLADIIIISYLLGEKLGTGYKGLDIKIINKLKVALLSEDNNSGWKNQLSNLSKYLNK